MITHYHPLLSACLLICSSPFATILRARQTRVHLDVSGRIGETLARCSSAFRRRQFVGRRRAPSAPARYRHMVRVSYSHYS